MFWKRKWDVKMKLQHWITVAISRLLSEDKRRLARKRRKEKWYCKEKKKKKKLKEKKQREKAHSIIGFSRSLQSMFAT